MLKQGHCFRSSSRLLSSNTNWIRKVTNTIFFFYISIKHFSIFLGDFLFFYKIVEINRLLFFFCSRKDFSIFLNRDIKIENSKINPR